MGYGLGSEDPEELSLYEMIKKEILQFLGVLLVHLFYIMLVVMVAPFKVRLYGN